MNKEDKELLLKDLCARLMYGVKVSFHGKVETLCEAHIYPNVQTLVGESGILYDAELVKPYLRPMSSMTEEEKKELENYLSAEIISSYSGLNETLRAQRHTANFLYSRHLDVLGLIEKELALEAPEGMYNKEESGKGSEVPIPKTVDEAVKTLAKVVSKEDRDYLLENGAISMHDSLGRWIRNEWGLWTDSELKNELQKKGFEHPDDMSNYIIEEFIKYWDNKL